MSDDNTKETEETGLEPVVHPDGTVTYRIPDEYTEEEKRARLQDIFKDMVERGIIEPDIDAPNCIECLKPLEKIDVGIILTLDPNETEEFDNQQFQWVKGMHQFMVSPGFFGFVEDGMARFDAKCSECGAPVMDLEIVKDPHGLVFGEMTRMAGKL